MSAKPKATVTQASPEEAKEIWDSLKTPSVPEVMAELTRRGRPTPRRTIERWKKAGWARADTGRPKVDIPTLEAAPKVIEKIIERGAAAHGEDAATEADCNAKSEAELGAHAARRVFTMVTVVADVITKNAGGLVALDPKGLGVLIKAVAGGLAEGQARHDRAIAQAAKKEDADRPKTTVIDSEHPLADIMYEFGLKRLAKNHGIKADIEHAVS